MIDYDIEILYMVKQLIRMGISRRRIAFELDIDDRQLNDYILKKAHMSDDMYYHLRSYLKEREKVYANGTHKPKNV
jgi:plasmid maintenance system antidote protein VapI